MVKYINLKTLCASLLSAVFSSAFAVAELAMGLKQEAATLDFKTALFSALGYFGYFLISFWVIVLCYEIAKKFVSIKILNAVLAFVFYFALESVFLYLTLSAVKVQGAVAISFADFLIFRLKSAQYIFSLQFFAIAYAFYKIFTSPKRK